MKPTYICLALVLTGCAAPPVEDPILEPITEANIYDPSADLAPPADDKERLVAAIEAEGCVLNAANSERVLTSLGLGQDQLGQIGAELMREGRVTAQLPADGSADAEFRLVSGTCAP